MKSSEGTFQGVWTLGEQRDGEISSVSYELLAWGRELADKRSTTLASVVLGHNVKGKVESLIQHGADVVYVVDHPGLEHFTPCLLYTSDAADDLLCVDLGGRRIIKKKKNR